MEATKFRSTILKNELNLWIYKPHGFSANGARYPLLILFDGDRNIKWISQILDFLIAHKQIPPIVAAMIDNPSFATRQLELPCYQPFADSLAKEPIPFLREQHQATTDPAKTIVAGSSYGGLAAVFAGLRYSNIFGNILSLSGSLLVEARNRKRARVVTKATRIRPQATPPLLHRSRTNGSYPAQIASNRHMREILKAKGNEIGYAEYNGGHSFLNWSEGTANGLIFLLGNPKSAAR